MDSRKCPAFIEHIGLIQLRMDVQVTGWVLVAGLTKIVVSKDLSFTFTVGLVLIRRLPDL